MQTKSYTRLLKWSLLACVTASLATACVVTTDDDGDDFFDGGDSNSGTSGKTSTTGGAGTSSTAGKTSTAGTTSAGTGGTSSAGTGGTGGSGGTTAPGEEIGLCQADDDPEPTDLPNCDPDAKDETDACRKCMRASCCSEWKTCYGSEPRTACGWGADPTDDFEGQYDCIRNCYVVKLNEDPSREEPAIIEDCSFECLKQCDEADGLPMDSTSALVECTTMSCNDVCFPPPM
jgi:hypothetical protein